MARDLVYPSFGLPRGCRGTCFQRRLWTDCADAQAELSPGWSHKSKCRFCRAVALILKYWSVVYQEKLAVVFSLLSITKCLYSFDPLKPHFYIVKLGFTGVYIIFLISAQKHRLWVLVRTARRGGSNEYPQSMFWAEKWNMSDFFIC